MNKGLAIIIASLIALALHERKNHLVLFGAIAMLIFFGTAAAFECLPHWVAESLGLAGLVCAFIAPSIAATRAFASMKKLSRRKG
jgi:hypothetical protein